MMWHFREEVSRSEYDSPCCFFLFLLFLSEWVSLSSVPICLIVLAA